jgi:NAD-dependent dihydropyrimidine dehydrogenase PreA subunit
MQLTIRDAKKEVAWAGERAVRLVEYPRGGELAAEAVGFAFDQFVGDETTRYFVEIVHGSGLREVHRIQSNDTETLLIDGDWYELPEKGDAALIKIELLVPKIDVSQCIGCGLCEHECPVVGDRRAVYVTAEGETRSQRYQGQDRNRSVRLLQTV